MLVKKQVIQTLVLFEILFLVSVVISLSMYNYVLSYLSTCGTLGMFATYFKMAGVM